jgi:PAS domain S-box-containing protein
VTITGYSQQDLIGKNYLEIVHPEHRDEVARFYGTQLVTRLPDTYNEFPILTKEAQIVWLGQHVQLLTQEDIVLGFQAICRDITQRRRTEDLQIQAARLQAVADLASGVAHNFNNLLQIVMGAAQLASANLDLGKNANAKKQLQDILESCRFGAETVKRLQSFANIRTDDTSSGKEVFDLSALVRQAVEMTRPWWKTAPEREALTVNLELDLADECWISGKPNEFFEVVVNLIKNAAEALHEGGDIRVATFVKSGQVVLRVSDTGVGLDQQSAARVFDPFWTTKGLNGTGMGLAASYGIISRHGGTISVESAKGKGSTFTVTVPLAYDTPETVGQFPSSSDRRLCVLVIDDVEATVAVLKEGLEHHFHTVFTALSGKEGLEIFKREPIDLVICDLGMPGLNGWQVGRAVKGICKEAGRPRTPFILLTGWGDQFDGDRVAESGVDAVLQKPTDFAGLMRVIRELLEKTGEDSVEKDSLPDS